MSENAITTLINTTPPVTRILTILIFITSLSIYLEIFSSYQLMLNFKPNEFYRLITSLFYFGPPNFDTILHIIFMYRYSKMLEESYVHTSDYFYFLFCVVLMIYLCAFLFNIVVLGPILSSVITYVWTRKNPYAQLQLFGFIVFPAFYLPFVIPLFSYISERRVLKGEIVGIFIGHVYYFFKFVFPTFGVDIFKTPVFFKKIFKEISDEPLVEEINSVDNDDSTDTSVNTENVEEILEDLEIDDLILGKEDEINYEEKLNEEEKDDKEIDDKNLKELKIKEKHKTMFDKEKNEFKRRNSH